MSTKFLTHIFRGKSVQKLDDLKQKVTLKIEQGQKTGADNNYWEALLKELAGYRAKVSLQEQHKRKEQHNLISFLNDN